MAEVPVLKLIFLGVRQISKPIANQAKQIAKNSDAFKAGTIAVGRALHRVQVTRRNICPWLQWRARPGQGFRVGLPRALLAWMP